MPETELVAARKEKLLRLQARGINPYPYGFSRTHTAADLREGFGSLAPAQHTGVEVAVAGRILAVRRMGKASFFDLHDRTGRIQIFATPQTLGPENYEFWLDALDIGDIVGIRGEVFTTKTGELSVAAEELVLLAKALRPLPEKWHGLRDVETRYRERALDFVANPRAREILIKRATILRTIRNFLDARGFIEVETPVLQPIPGGAAARPFVTHHHELGRDLYLRIAPELYLKRLLVGGLEKVYEIGRNFRNEGVSSEHNPEFTALEAYEAYTDYQGMMELAEGLIEACVLAVAGTTRLEYQGRWIDFSRPWRRVGLLELVAEATGCDVEKPLAELLLELDRRGIAIPEHLKRGPKGKVIEHLLETCAEKTLWDPSFVLDYPLDISPLAKRKRDRPDLVERFELYIAGREVANAFSELNDPEEQRERFWAQEKLRAQGDEEAQRIDEDFVRDLELGMPPAGGIGVGLDRLTMILTNSPSIREVLAFPLLR